MGGRAGFVFVLLALAGCDTRLAPDLDAGAGKLDVVSSDAGTLDVGTLDVLPAIDQGTEWGTCTTPGTGPWCQNHLFNAAMMFPLPMDAKPEGIATGDFNSDGVLDLAVGTSDGVTAILQQAGAQTSSSYKTPHPARLVVTDDFDGDGKLDLVVAGGSDNCCCGHAPCESQFSVLLGNGDGTFQSPWVDAKQAYPATAMVTADFNSDRVPDLVIVGAPHKGRLLLGKGDGTFGQAFSFGVAEQVSGVYTADFNADGISDLLVGEGPLKILLGKGKEDNGTFFHSPAVVCDGPGDIVTAAAVGDFNEDGILDIAAAGGPPLKAHTLSIVLGNGQNGKWDGTCAAPRLSTVASDGPIVTGDFDCDGILDLAFSSPIQGLSVARGNSSNGVGDGTFGPAETVIPDGVPAMVAADFDNNGGAEIALVDSQGALLLNPTRTRTRYAIDVGSEYLVTGDFNADGVQDLATVSSASSMVAVLLGNGTVGAGDGMFAGPAYYSLVSGKNKVDWATLATADLNGDKILDLVVSDSAGGPIKVLLGNGSNGKGDGTFGSVIDSPGGWDARLFALADFNSDGVLDIALLSSDLNPPPWVSTDNVEVMLGDGAGKFVPGASYAWNGAPTDIATGDFNADGIVDLVVTDHDTNDLAVMLGKGTGGKGDGTFAVAVTFPLGGDKPTSIAVDDLNGDGILDLAVANWEKSVSVLFGKGAGGTGDGTFAAPVVYPTQGPNSRIKTADVNTDGNVDLVVQSWFSTIVLLGSSGGTFLPPLYFSRRHDGGEELAIADFNADGIPDLATTSHFDDSSGKKSFVDITLGTGGNCK